MGISFDVYCDESYLSHQYRAIACVSVPKSNVASVAGTVRDCLTASGVGEFKWSKCKDARRRRAAEKLIELTLDCVGSALLRVDVLSWNTKDSRHEVIGRDDAANFERMFYQLLKWTIEQRRPGSTWKIFCDQKDGVAWPTIHNCLQAIGAHRPPEPDVFGQGPRQKYVITHLTEVESQATPLVQLADLFAGLCGFSRNRYDSYATWRNERQGVLLPIRRDDAPREVPLSDGDRVRFALLEFLCHRAAAARVSVSLESSRGLRSWGGRWPINFWPYEPQREDDKAPTR